MNLESHHWRVGGSAKGRPANDDTLFPKSVDTFSSINRNAYNLVREKLQNAGVKVHEVSEEMANAMASLIGVEFATKGKSATETVLLEDESSFKGTAISTADGAKILKNLDSIIF